ncbi:hypothetical protein AGLY_001798 [Aphis glycines]|uniref:C2H2-type domain-containing protein n=1 Tax=Aphis glycines TaxID=307491 RepID=A0A6G0U667_APHGL|nr:hypothetical protein AGLY_001798 [Aphis glycines]
MSEIPQIKCEPQDIILNKYIKQEPIDEPIEFDHDNDHDIPPNNQCSTKDYEFSTDKVKDEIKLEVDEIDGVIYESICVTENYVLSPMTSCTTNGIKSHNKKNSINAPEINHNTDTQLKSCSTKDSEFSTDKSKNDIKLEVDEIDGIIYESICVAENHELPPKTPSMKNSTKSYNKKKTINAPEINHNTNTPFKFRSTKDSEFSTDKGKNDIKLEVDEIDDIIYESICVAENHELPPKTPSMKNSTKSYNKKKTINAPEINHNTNTLFKFRSTKDSEFSTDKGKNDIKLEVDEIDDIIYESICVAENHELPPKTPSMKNSTKSYNKKKTINAPEINHNTNTPFKFRSTKDSEFSTDKGKNDIKLEVDEIDGIIYESICVAENHELPPKTPSMKNSTKSYNKKKTINAPEINHNTNTPFKFRSTKDSEFSTDKGKNYIKLEVDEIDGIIYESICVAENHELPPKTSSMKNSTKSHNNKNSIKAPKIVYNTNRPFKCDTCNKRFIRKEHLKTHKFIHTGKRPYKCETCDKSFTRKDNFKSHQMIHSGEKPFKCGVCNKSFLHKGHIRNHIRIHTGERPYKCNVCGKSFLQEGHLKTHKKIHSGERPYKCHRCDQSYSRKDNLESHKKIHLGEKPFICDICKKNFLQKGHVRIHMRTHTGEKPFKCVYCNKTFSRKDNMKDHIARLHTK